MLSAPGRKPPRHVFCAQLQEMGLLSWSSAKRFHLGKKGACGRLGAVHCPAVAAMRGLLGRAPKSYPGSGPFVTRKDSPISELRSPRVSTEFRSSQVRGSQVRSTQSERRIANSEQRSSPSALPNSEQPLIPLSYSHRSKYAGGW